MLLFFYRSLSSEFGSHVWVCLTSFIYIVIRAATVDVDCSASCIHAYHLLVRTEQWARIRVHLQRTHAQLFTISHTIYTKYLILISFFSVLSAFFSLLRSYFFSFIFIFGRHQAICLMRRHLNMLTSFFRGKNNTHVRVHLTSGEAVTAAVEPIGMTMETTVTHFSAALRLCGICFVRPASEMGESCRMHTRTCAYTHKFDKASSNVKKVNSNENVIKWMKWRRRWWRGRGKKIEIERIRSSSTQCGLIIACIAIRMEK